MPENRQLPDFYPAFPGNLQRRGKIYGPGQLYGLSSAITLQLAGPGSLGQLAFQLLGEAAMLFRLVCALVLVGGLAAPLKASLISGTGGSTTNAQLAGGSLINFDTTAAGDYATLTINNVTFTGVDAPITIGPDFIGQYNNTGINSLFNGFDYVPTAFLIEFASPVKAFGFNWGAADSNWVLSAFNSASALIETHVIAPTFGSNNGDYYGIAAADISFVTLSVVASSTLGDDDYVFIDDFVTVTGDGVVPEPATLLVWAGLAAVGTTVYVVRRNKA